MSSSLTLCNKEQRILWDCDVPKKWILYKKWRWLVSSVLGLRRSSKALPKAKLHQKRSWSLFGDLLPVWSTTAFWIPEKPLYLRSMFSKSMRYPENCNACSHHWSTEGPILHQDNCTTNTLKVERIGLQCFCLICHIHLTSCQVTTIFLSISTTFCSETLPWATRGWKCFLRVHWIPKHKCLCYRSKHFSLAKLCWLQWFIFWLIKICLILLIMI